VCWPEVCGALFALYEFMKPIFCIIFASLSCGSPEIQTFSVKTEPLVGCFEAPRGDDNRNIYRFEANGNLAYLDTWNRSAGEPTTKLSYVLEGRQFTISGRAMKTIDVQPDSLLFIESDERWLRVPCADFNW
jgi:hypothetical protein